MSINSTKSTQKSHKNIQEKPEHDSNKFLVNNLGDFFGTNNTKEKQSLYALTRSEMARREIKKMIEQDMNREIKEAQPICIIC